MTKQQHINHDKQLYNICGISNTVCWTNKHGQKFPNIGEVISVYIVCTEAEAWGEAMSLIMEHQSDDFDVYPI